MDLVEPGTVREGVVAFSPFNTWLVVDNIKYMNVVVSLPHMVVVNFWQLNDGSLGDHGVKSKVDVVLSKQVDDADSVGEPVDCDEDYHE